MKRFCVECGVAFESDSKLTRYCPACAEKHKQEQKQKQKQYAKARQEKLGLVTVTIYSHDKEYLQTMGKEEKIILAEVLHRIIVECDIENQKKEEEKAKKKK